MGHSNVKQCFLYGHMVPTFEAFGRKNRGHEMENSYILCFSDISPQQVGEEPLNFRIFPARKGVGSV